MAKVLIVDDEEFIRDILSKRVRRLQHQATVADTLARGRDLIGRDVFDLVFLDVNLPDGNGLEFLKEINRIPSPPEVIIITAVGSPEGGAMAIRNGAWDYLRKPLSKDDIILRINRALSYRQIKQQNVTPVRLKTDEIIGKSRAINHCLNQVSQCAAGRSNVLLLGETGTGKELFARAIHENCTWTEDRFVTVDCAAMPESLAESVLFGHVKGAFTGADKASEGLVLKAHKGTLFLDEIGELPLNMQSTFLRVLQERKFRPVGSSVERSSDFRLICATNRNLEEMAAKGTFRSDLLHRIKTFTIELPPLRERKSDIQELAAAFVKTMCDKHQLSSKVLLPETLSILESHNWPGNVRELAHTIERAVMGEPDSPVIFPLFLPEQLRIQYMEQGFDSQKGLASAGSSTFVSVLGNILKDDPVPSLKAFRNSALEEIEKTYLHHLLSKTGWDLDRTAEISQLSKNRVYVLMKKYNLKSK